MKLQVSIKDGKLRINVKDYQTWIVISIDESKGEIILHDDTIAYEPSSTWLDKFTHIKDWFEQYTKHPERFGMDVGGNIMPIYYVKADEMRVRINEIATKQFHKMAIESGIMTIADKEQHPSWALSALHPALSDADDTYVYMGAIFGARTGGLKLVPTIIHLPYGITESPQFDVYPLNSNGELAMPVKTIIDMLEQNVGVLVDPLAVDENGYLRIHYLDIK